MKGIRNNGHTKEKIETIEHSELNPKEILCNNDPNYKTDFSF